MPVTVPAGLSIYDGSKLVPVGVPAGIRNVVLDNSGDWCAASDTQGMTGDLFGDIIGSSFDPYRTLGTATAIAASSSAKAIVWGDSAAQSVVANSPTAASAGLLYPLTGVSIGDPLRGGYFAGIIDTTVGNIIAADASQTGLRYALIVAGASKEDTSIRYKTTNDDAPAASQTRWDGLSATQAMAAAGATYEAATYCDGLAVPADDASQWYLPAMDELDLIYWLLKCSTEANYTGNRSGGDFPGGTVNYGENSSSDPTRPASTTSVPGQTSVTAFKTGNAEALGASGSNIYYWTATEYNSSYAWFQGMSGSGAGRQSLTGKSLTRRVRPVRRLAL